MKSRPRHFGRVMCLTALMFASAQAFAQTDTQKTVYQLGVELGAGGAPDNAYFSVNGGFSASCPYGVVYIDMTTEFGRAAYAQLLAAKNTGQELSRIDYSPGGSLGLCWLSLIEVSN